MGFITAVKGNTSASVDWLGDVVVVSTRCSKCKVMREDDYTLREFLTALNITAEDCQKAFSDGEHVKEPEPPITVSPFPDGWFKSFNAPVQEDVELETIDTNDAETFGMGEAEPTEHEIWTNIDGSTVDLTQNAIDNETLRRCTFDE